MYVEVSAKEALEAYSEGKRVVCLERGDGVDGMIDTFTLESMLNGFAFMIDTTKNPVVPAEDDPADKDVLPPLRENGRLKSQSRTNHLGNQKLILEKY